MSLTTSRSPDHQLLILGPALLVPICAVVFVPGKSKDTSLHARCCGLILVQLQVDIKPLANMGALDTTQLPEQMERFRLEKLHYTSDSSASDRNPELLEQRGLA